MPRGRRDPLTNDPPSGDNLPASKRDEEAARVRLRDDADRSELPGAAAEVPAGVPREREERED